MMSEGCRGLCVGQGSLCMYFCLGFPTLTFQAQAMCPERFLVLDEFNFITKKIKIWELNERGLSSFVPSFPF